MSFDITSISETEFRVNSIYVYQDHNGKWIATPPIDSQPMQDAVNDYIKNLLDGR